MKQIPITQGRFAIVDDEDFERIAAHSWAINPQGTGYAVRKGSKRRGEPRTVHMHREVLGLTGGEIVDHINGNKYDNRVENLCVMPLAEHTRMHMKNACTEETRKALSMRAKGKPHYYCRKFTDSQVAEIKEMVKNGASCYSLAKKYGVAKTTIGRMVRGLQYAEL